MNEDGAADQLPSSHLVVVPPLRVPPAQPTLHSTPEDTLAPRQPVPERVNFDGFSPNAEVLHELSNQEYRIISSRRMRYDNLINYI